MWNNSALEERWPSVEEDGCDAFVGSVSEYPRLEYSRKAVRKAGRRLAGQIRPTSGNDLSDAREIFSIAHSWRDSHFLPMRSVYYSVRHKLRDRSIKGDMASRPKRMESIRRKLRESSVELDQMNDIAGCRAILNDIAGVRHLTELIREKFPHELRQEWPYIDKPKDDGYRSHHLVFNFCPRKRDQDAFKGRRIELQVRTRLQHSWATAVEAVGLFNGEDLKHHKGSKDWLRLFKLVSAEFAHVEGCPIGNNIPDRDARVQEIKHLNQELNAVDLLENIRMATDYAENFIHDRGRYFLIIYRPNHTVEVENYDHPIQVTTRLANVEREIEEKADASKVVVVEVDRVEKLIETYPNYFGDVSLFTRNLRRICKGQAAQEYTMTPQQVVAPKEYEKPDPTLLIRRYRRWDEIR